MAPLGLLLTVMLGACGSGLTVSTGAPAPAVAGAGGSSVAAADGRELFVRSGCAACHVAPGIRGAIGAYGPDLTGVGARPTIAGGIPNTPENLWRWLLDPAAMKPDAAMPQMNLTEQEAEALARFLATLR